MRAALFGGPRSIQVGERPDPTVGTPTDAVVRVVLGCRAPAQAARSSQALAALDALAGAESRTQRRTRRPTRSRVR